MQFWHWRRTVIFENIANVWLRQEFKFVYEKEDFYNMKMQSFVPKACVLGMYRFYVETKVQTPDSRIGLWHFLYQEHLISSKDLVFETHLYR